MSIVYILTSKKADQYYVGYSTVTFELRYDRHLNHYYKNKFTASYDDWEMFLIIECASDKQGIQIEKHIKSMKSSKYIKNLKLYPEIIEKLKGKYKDSSSEPR